MNRHIEQEWQFSAHELGLARNWLASQPHAQSERRFAIRSTLQLQDTYYDSSDWMIYRAGYALRIRSAREDAGPGDAETEITLKSLHTAHAGPARRTEISERVASSDMGAVLARRQGIGERIRELVGTRSLTPLFRARTRRERQQLLEADSELPLAEVDLDETLIETPSGAEQQLTRVEVECINAEPAALAPWVAELREAAQLQVVEVSKFRAGLIAAGLDPARPLEPGNIDISPTQAFAQTQRSLLRRYFAVVLDTEPRVRAGSASAVHQMRVAARHLEVLLRIFRGFGPEWAVRERGAVRTLVKALGEVSDCDVQLAHLEDSRVGSDESERPALGRVLEQLERVRRKMRERLLATLDSERIRGWAATWLENLRAGTAGGVRAQQATTAKVAQDLIREQARRFRKRADRLGEKSSSDEYHEVRIRAKRLRYTLDAFEGLYGEPARDYARALGKLQDVLGAYHDATVREQQFARLVADAKRLPSSTSFMMGRLVERDLRAFDRCRAKFPRAYRRIKRRRWRALSEAMRAQASSDGE
jgi:CHAD domain-containing protein